MNKLVRSLSFRQATAINMIDMVGIGPFVSMPLVMGAMNGPACLIAWLLGALLSFCDGSVWAELGAKYPEAGGSYIFLKKLFGEKKSGKLFSFLYIWQTSFQAPLVLASAAIGFTQYLSFFVPLETWQQKMVSGGVIMLATVLLYRRVESAGNISLVLWSAVIATFTWIIFTGATHFNATQAFDFPATGTGVSALLFAGLGQASVKTIYCYLGYYNVCHLGSEIKDPERNIPRSIFISITGITVLYLLMQISVLGVVPWQEGRSSTHLMSDFFGRTYGHTAAGVATALILLIALSGLFSAMLGYSRIPYAAAAAGDFFPAFAKVHPVKKFPHVSLLVLAAVAFLFSLLFKLSEVITALITMRILVQFVLQAFGVILLRMKKDKPKLPFRMKWFPLPALVAIVIWLALFFSVEWKFISGSIVIIASGTLLFLIRSKKRQQWPYEEKIPAAATGH